MMKLKLVEDIDILKEAIKKNTLTKQQQKIIEKVFSDPILSKLADENKWSELLPHISYEEAKDLEIIDKKVSLAIPENFSKDHPTYKEYLKVLESRKSWNKQDLKENDLLLDLIHIAKKRDSSLIPQQTIDMLAKYGAKVSVEYGYPEITFIKPESDINNAVDSRPIYLISYEPQDIEKQIYFLKTNWVDKIRKTLARNRAQSYRAYDEYNFDDINFKNIRLGYDSSMADDRDALEKYIGKPVEAWNYQDLERVKDWYVIKRQNKNSSDKLKLKKDIEKDKAEAADLRAQKAYHDYGDKVASIAAAEDELDRLAAKKSVYKEELELEEGKKSKKKRKNQTQDNPVFKSVDDLKKWVKKRQKGLSPFTTFNSNAGNVLLGNAVFNGMFSADGGSGAGVSDGGISNGGLSAPSGDCGGLAMGEALSNKDEEKNYIEISSSSYLRQYKHLLDDHLDEFIAELYKFCDEKVYLNIINMLKEADIELPNPQQVLDRMIELGYEKGAQKSTLLQLEKDLGQQ